MKVASGSKGNVQTDGNKGSNYPWQIKVLQGLECINNSILSTASAAREFEVNTVRDTGNGDYIALEILVWNEATNTFDPPIYQNADGTVYVPVGPLVYVDDTTMLSLILAQETLIAGFLTPITRTPTKVLETGVGSYGLGARSVSIWNKGAAVGTVMGVIIEPGEMNTFDAGGEGDTLSAIAVDGTGTTLVITLVA